MRQNTFLATKAALLEIANTDARVLQTPLPAMHIMELGED